MIKLTFSQLDIDDLNYWRFHHPDPIVMQRCETVYLRAKGLKTGEIRELTGRNVKTIRADVSDTMFWERTMQSPESFCRW
jgi:hypothetical protein